MGRQSTMLTYEEQSAIEMLGLDLAQPFLGELGLYLYDPPRLRESLRDFIRARWLTPRKDQKSPTVPADFAVAISGCDPKDREYLSWWVRTVQNATRLGGFWRTSLIIAAKQPSWNQWKPEGGIDALANLVTDSYRLLEEATEERITDEVLAAKSDWDLQELERQRLATVNPDWELGNGVLDLIERVQFIELFAREWRGLPAEVQERFKPLLIALGDASWPSRPAEEIPGHPGLLYPPTAPLDPFTRLLGWQECLERRRNLVAEDSLRSGKE